MSGRIKRVNYQPPTMQKKKKDPSYDPDQGSDDSNSPPVKKSKKTVFQDQVKEAEAMGVTPFGFTLTLAEKEKASQMV